MANQAYKNAVKNQVEGFNNQFGNILSIQSQKGIGITLYLNSDGRIERELSFTKGWKEMSKIIDAFRAGYLWNGTL